MNLQALIESLEKPCEYGIECAEAYEKTDRVVCRDCVSRLKLTNELLEYLKLMPAMATALEDSEYEMGIAWDLLHEQLTEEMKREMFYYNADAKDVPTCRIVKAREIAKKALTPFYSLTKSNDE